MTQPEVMRLLRTARDGIVRLNDSTTDALKEFQKQREVLADAAEAADAPDDYVGALRRRPCRSTGL